MEELLPETSWVIKYVEVVNFLQDELKLSAEEYDRIVTILYASKDFKYDL